jgi:hypothetical protein
MMRLGKPDMFACDERLAGLQVGVDSGVFPAWVTALVEALLFLGVWRDVEVFAPERVDRQSGMAGDIDEPVPHVHEDDVS